MYIARILFNNDAQLISSNSAETWYRNMTFSLKCIMEKNAFEDLLFDSAGTKEKMRLMYINGFILEACHIMHGKLDTFSTTLITQKLLYFVTFVIHNSHCQYVYVRARERVCVVCV